MYKPTLTRLRWHASVLLGVQQSGIMDVGSAAQLGGDMGSHRKLGIERIVQKISEGLLVSGRMSKSEVADDAHSSMFAKDQTKIVLAAPFEINIEWSCLFRGTDTANVYRTEFRGTPELGLKGKWPFAQHDEMDVVYDPVDGTLTFLNIEAGRWLNCWQKIDKLELGVEGRYVDYNHNADPIQYYPGTRISTSFCP